MNSDKKFRTIIVDDEMYARRDLIELIDKFPCIEIIGEAKSIQSAVEIIEQLKPDLIFLDIQFPGETGFDLFEKTNVNARVVFVTAYNEYAIRAFEVNACDYLLKPVNPNRLEMTIKRILEYREELHTSGNAFNNEDSIYIQLNNYHYFIRIDTIIKITAADHFTEILTINGQKGLSNKQLNEWHKCLPADSFIQVHRSSIVNMNFVEKISRGAYYSHQIKMKCMETPIPISRKYLKQIKEKFPFKNLVKT